MTLADTSIWVNHLRVSNATFAEHLERGAILTHPVVICELACGNLPRRKWFLSHLAALPQAETGTTSEAIRLIEDRRLWGTGIGASDAHLLVASLLSGCRLWTLDAALQKAAEKAGVPQFHPFA